MNCFVRNDLVNSSSISNSLHGVISCSALVKLIKCRPHNKIQMARKIILQTLLLINCCIEKLAQNALFFVRHFKFYSWLRTIIQFVENSELRK